MPPPPPPPPPRVLPAPASDGTLSLAMASLASDETDEALAPELARLEIVSVMGEGEEAQLASQGADTATAPAYGVLSDAESEASLKRYKSSSTLIGIDWLN